MNPLVLLAFVAIGIAIILPIWILSKVLGQDSINRALHARIDALERAWNRAQSGRETGALVSKEAAQSAAPPAETARPMTAPPPAAPPLLHSAAANTALDSPLAEPVRGKAPTAPGPMASSMTPRSSEAAAAAHRQTSRGNWEQFVGARMFAWLGGLALLLGVAFFVKYSFEHALIPPEARVSMGFILGAGLIAGGLKISRQRYAITAQTLCASGIVSLYAVTYACHAVYAFAPFGTVPSLLLMSLITAAGFALAVRLEARVVAVLGLFGGFLTPFLMGSGGGDAFSLFGYVALLDVGLLAIALRQSWAFLVPLGAAGSVLVDLFWTSERFTVGEAPTSAVVATGLSLLFLAGHALARRRGCASRETRATAATLPFFAFAYALFLLVHPNIDSRLEVVFTLVFAADAVLLALSWIDEALPDIHRIGGLCVFGLLALWTTEYLSSATLLAALGLYLAHGILHTAYPLLLARRRPASEAKRFLSFVPAVSLLLLFGPLFKLGSDLSWMYWPAVLVIDLLAVGLAIVSASIAGLAAVLALTVLATAVWLFQIPTDAGDLPGLMTVIVGFSLFFVAAGLLVPRWLGERLRARVEGSGLGRALGGPTEQIPAIASVLPFVLLVLATARLRLADATPIYGTALGLVILSLALSAALAIEWLPAFTLAGVAALQYALQGRPMLGGSPGTELAWHACFIAVFAVFPFAFRRRFAGITGPWAVAAAAGIVHFPLVLHLVRSAWAPAYPGMVPALFALPPLASLAALQLNGRAAGAGLNPMDASAPGALLNQKAWFGGAFLFFLTVLIPIQFRQQWITLGWALEGAALLAYFHRVAHPGLRATGVVLLGLAFIRLAANPAVLAYHVRGEEPILNGYLTSYGIASACLFAGARLLQPPRDLTFGMRVPPLLNTMAVILAFLLLNIEIADYFSPPGTPVLTLEFSGNLARDMTYTIAWGLFALGLLLASLQLRTKAGRYAAIGLLTATLLKLFFHDLAQLGALYRIGALFAVAIIAILASFAYQRFLPGREGEP